MEVFDCYVFLFSFVIVMDTTPMNKINDSSAPPQAYVTTSAALCPKMEVSVSLQDKIEVYSILNNFIRDITKNIYVGMNQLHPLLLHKSKSNRK